MNANWSAIKATLAAHRLTLAASALIFLLAYISAAKHLGPDGDSEARLARYSQVAAELPRLQATLRETGNKPRDLATSPNVTGADLQTRLGRMARDGGLTVSSSEANPPNDEPGARPNVMIVVDGPLAALQRFIYAIETGAFGWTIDLLEIQPDALEEAATDDSRVHASMRVSSP